MLDQSSQGALLGRKSTRTSRTCLNRSSTFHPINQHALIRLQANYSLRLKLTICHQSGRLFLDVHLEIVGFNMKLEAHTYENLIIFSTQIFQILHHNSYPISLFVTLVH